MKISRIHGDPNGRVRARHHTAPTHFGQLGNGRPDADRRGRRHSVRADHPLPTWDEGVRHGLPVGIQHTAHRILEWKIRRLFRCRRHGSPSGYKTFKLSSGITSEYAVQLMQDTISDLELRSRIFSRNKKDGFPIQTLSLESAEHRFMFSTNPYGSFESNYDIGLTANTFTVIFLSF